MSKIIVLLVLTIGLASCKTSEKEIDKLEIAKEYYRVLDHSDSSKIENILKDSLTTIDDGYKQVYDQTGYIEWLKWDSVFEPNYKILQIEQENEIIKAKISKIDKRIVFLHKLPIVTDEIIHFKNNKIVLVERNSAIFNVPTFLKNREELVDWINENHPDLNGFLHDQTESGGINYLKAIELYRNRK